MQYCVLLDHVVTAPLLPTTMYEKTSDQMCHIVIYIFVNPSGVGVRTEDSDKMDQNV